MFSAVVTDIPSTYKEYIIRVKQIGHFSVFFVLVRASGS